MDWNAAEKWLNELIFECKRIGFPGLPVLMCTLYPLRRRYESGERSEELYQAIMKYK